VDGMAEKLRPGNGKRIARERIDILFAQAAEWADGDTGRAERCIALARRIAMKQRLRMPKRYRRQFCRTCYGYLVPGRTARVRIQHGKVIVTCLLCRDQRRYPVVKEHNGKV